MNTYKMRTREKTWHISVIFNIKIKACKDSITEYPHAVLSVELKLQA